jgi:hypothetical protein
MAVLYNTLLVTRNHDNAVGIMRHLGGVENLNDMYVCGYGAPLGGRGFKTILFVAPDTKDDGEFQRIVEWKNEVVMTKLYPGGKFFYI